MVGANVSLGNLARPDRMQLAFQEMEIGVFIHYSIDTYGGKRGQSPASVFAPTSLDTEQWVLAAKAMGAKFVVLTARHEQGFCLWPTATTDYSIKSSPYRGGKGDIVREFVDSCRKHDLRPGLYNPPWIDDHWDAHQLGLTPSGDNGSISKYDDPVIYDLVLKKESAQLHELMTNYGPLALIWDDHFGRSDSLGRVPHGGRLRDLYASLARLAHSFQPDCLYFGPDVEHVGNEEGVAAYPLWNPVDTLDGTPYTISTTYKWGRDNAGDPLGKFYRPRLGPTTDGFSTGGWMWDGPRRPLSLEKHMQVYYDTVGRGACVIINLTPDRTGLVPDDLVASAQEFGDEVTRRFSHSVGEATGRGDVITVRFAEDSVFDHIVTMEDLTGGQKIARYKLEAETDGRWMQLVEGLTVGHKRINRVSPTRARAVRFTCTEALARPVALRRIRVYDSAHKP